MGIHCLDTCYPNSDPAVAEGCCFLPFRNTIPWLSDFTAFGCNCGDAEFLRITTACGGIWEPQQQAIKSGGKPGCEDLGSSPMMEDPAVLRAMVPKCSTNH